MDNKNINKSTSNRSLEDSQELAQILQKLQESDMHQDYRLDKLTDNSKSHDKKIQSIENELKASVDELKEEVKANYEKTTSELNELAKSEQEYKDDMSKQVKQILFTIIGAIITLFINNALPFH